MQRKGEQRADGQGKCKGGVPKRKKSSNPRLKIVHLDLKKTKKEAGGKILMLPPDDGRPDTDVKTLRLEPGSPPKGKEEKDTIYNTDECGGRVGDKSGSVREKASA